MTTAYDRVPYASQPFAVTHPSHLGVMGRVFGLNTAPPESCRMLEIGCSSGGNLLPLAVAYPESTFVGIDAADSALEIARSRAQALGLRNVHFQTLRIENAREVLDTHFEYIVANGVYSWLPRPVQTAMLQLIRQSLARNGVAYVSHNVLPGWHLRNVVREMALMHTNALDEPGPKVAQTQALLEFLRNGSHSHHTAWKSILEHELKTLHERPPWFTWHDLLATHNSADYFRDMVHALEQEHLQFLADASIRTMFPHEFDASTRETLLEVAKTVQAMEQYMDMLRGRVYRQTLICHADQPLQRTVGWETLRFMRVRAALDRSTPIDFTHDAPASFVNDDGARITVTRTTTKHALDALRTRAPDSLRFQEIFELASERSNEAMSPEAFEALGRDLLTAWTHGALSLSISPARYTTEILERPTVFAHARLEGTVDTTVTNLLHQRVDLGAWRARLCAWVDGTRTVEQLVSVARQLGPPARHIDYESAVMDALNVYARNALLVGT